MHKATKILLIIFFLALLLRVIHLPSTPLGFHADEVRVGWNAWSILKTGKDDRGNTLALYYNTFGDFRPTGIFYLTIPSLIIFGKTIFAVRLPSALLGAASIFPFYLLTKEILNRNKHINYVIFLPSLFLAINPWHIQTSRSTSEVVISTFFVLFGLYFLLQGIRTGAKKSFFYCFLFLLVSYLFYHSIRLLAPLMVAVIGLYFWKQISSKNIKKYLAVVFLSIGALTVLLINNPSARGRFSQVSIFNDLDVQHELSRMPFEEGPGKIFIARMFHNKPSAYARRFVNEYVSYFSSDFFISDTAKPGRYTTIGVGLITYVEFALLIAGLVAIAQKKNFTSALPLLLLLVAPLAAALTTEDAPNLHRAFLMLPFLMIIETFGFVYLIDYKKTLKPILITLLTLNFIFFSHMYLVHARNKIQRDRSFGAKELAVKINEVQSKYDKIIVTNIPDDPYPWIAFFGDKDPKTFNTDAVKRTAGVWQTENLTFTGQRCPSRDAFTKLAPSERILVVDAESCATESKLNDNPDVVILEQIKRTDEARGDVYTLWATK